MTEEEQYLGQIKELYTQRDNELKSKFITMLFTYQKVLSCFSTLKNELDDVLKHIEDLKVETLDTFYRPILDQANELLSKIEMLDKEVQSDQEIKNLVSFVASHNITQITIKLDSLSSIIKDKIQDDKAFEKAINTNTKVSFVSYLENYSNGLHVNEAQNKIIEIEQAEQRISDECQAFETAKQKNTIEGYREYFSQFQDGLYSEEALKKITDLMKIEKIQTENERDCFFNQPLGLWLLKQFENKYKINLRNNKMALQRIYEQSKDIEEKLRRNNNKYTIDLPFLEHHNGEPIHWSIELTDKIVKKIYNQNLKTSMLKQFIFNLLN